MLLLLSTLISVLVLPVSLALQFTVSQLQPTQCDTITFRWTGGVAPYILTIIPAFDYPQNITLPGDAYSSNDGTGSYSWTVNYPGGTTFVAMLSDGTGHGSGGVSQLMSVTNSSTASCRLRSTETDFLFYLNATQVTQCSPLQIYWDKTASAPVTILGVIPGGQPFMFQPARQTYSYVWNTNIAAGTQFILAAFDYSSTQTGGSSALLTVGGSGNAACLDDLSPSSTPVPTSTATSTGRGGGGGAVIKTVTAIATVAPENGGNRLGTGSIVGIVLGALVGFAVLQGLVFWFCCRRQLAALISHRREMRGREIKRGGEVDLVSHHHQSMQDAGAEPTDEMSISPSRRTSALFSGPGTRFARSSLGDGESAISPFWDGMRVSDSQTSLRRPQPAGDMVSLSTLPSFDFEPNSNRMSDFARPHIRTDSLSTTQSRPYSHHTTDLPYMGSSGTAASPTASPYTPLSASSSRPLINGSRQTKAQMAASLSASDLLARQTGMRDLEGERQPRQEIPEGGFVRHEDAGRLDGPDIEHLPPVYRPEWETESQRERGRRGSG